MEPIDILRKELEDARAEVAEENAHRRAAEEELDDAKRTIDYLEGVIERMKADREAAIREASRK